MPMTSYLRKALGDASIGKSTFTTPASVYLGLFKASPGDSGSQSNEVTGGSYARVALTALLNSFNAVTGIVENNTVIDFPNPTGDWGVPTHIGILDASSAGNMLYYEALPNPRNVPSGSRRVQFAVGALLIRLI